jgi:DNA processing protein
MSDSFEKLRYLLAFVHMSGVGPIRIAEVLKTGIDIRTLIDHKGYCAYFKRQIHWIKVDQDLAWATRPGCKIIMRDDPTYPLLLNKIPDAPPLLFVQGNVAILNQLQIAIVGSRNPTPIGLENALNFARYFSDQGMVVTSGLAVGVDGAAHQGALSGNSGTVAVLANGLDQIYPTVHGRLAQQILDQAGALVSEFPIRVPPLPNHFPRRNRIISGLSVGTLVVEAAINSGSLITAKLALEQGREVFAIPGSIHSSLVKGCHALIREGAKLVETASDVLEELGALKGYIESNKKERIITKNDRPSLEGDYQSLLNRIAYTCMPVDSIVVQSGLTASSVSIMLLELELWGYVRAVPGGYRRI